MNIQRIPHYIKKFLTLGPIRSIQVIRRRVISHVQERRLRKKAATGNLARTWAHIAQTHSIASFSSFLEQLKTQSLPCIDTLYSEKDKRNAVAQADLFVQKTFDILGSGPVSFEKIAWHSDFRLYNQNSQYDHFFDANAFYKNIVVKNGTTDVLAKDIKLPWELSRFQHLLVLGYAYRQTGNEKYAAAFKEHVSDWIDSNSYGLGPNWVCPMDVGIRAINWVVGFCLFKDSKTIDANFWQTFSTSLYNHMLYLEQNWEIYDGRTSNHYLSDLVGYLYLCWFFQSLSSVDKKLSWCANKIEREFSKQVFDEGTDYEGSVAYHGLVTELFFHAYLLFQEMKIDISDGFEDKLRSMFDFLGWCPSNLVQIGDNDSGKILWYGLTRSIINNMAHQTKQESKTFPRFGVSVIKNRRVHLSLRMHAYNRLQPSGHFHNDVGSITLAVDGIPVIVDPGSYVYTASAPWRNRFRSVENHNMFYMTGSELVELDNRLFALDIKEHSQKDEPSNNEFILSVQHSLYNNYTAVRQLVHDEHKGTIIMHDSWKPGAGKGNVDTSWNLTFHPDIHLVTTEADVIVLCKDRELMRISSQELLWNIVDGWYSGGYGLKRPCKQLKAWVSLAVGRIVETIFSLS